MAIIKMELLNPFITAGMSVLAGEAGLHKVVSGKPSMISADCTFHAVNVVLGVNGGAKGIVVYGMELYVAKTIVKTMVGEMISMSDPMADSVLGEIGSWITGKATDALEKAGVQCSISTPRLVKGTRVRLTPVIIPMLAVPITTELGELRIYLALSESSTTTKVG